MQKIIILFLLFIYLGATSVKSQNAGKTGLSFLKIGVDARAIGMGEAYTAVANDASAVYWNPAGLLGTKRSNVLFNHNEWIQDIRGEFAAISFIRKTTAWGFHLRSFNIGDIEIREFPSTEPLEKTSAHYLSVGISYARRIHPRVDVGLSFKYLNEKIFVESASGIAADLGIVYNPPYPDFKVGFAIQNVGKMNNLKTAESKLPRLVRAGLMYQVPFKSEKMNVIFAGDIVKPIDENVHFNLGTEFVVWQQLALRVGYWIGYEARDISFGVGFLKSSIRLDYGMTPLNDNLGITHRFTINFNL